MNILDRYSFFVTYKERKSILTVQFKLQSRKECAAGQVDKVHRDDRYKRETLNSQKAAAAQNTTQQKRITLHTELSQQAQ